LPEIGPDGLEEEDAAFREYLIQNGYDVSTLGTKQHDSEVTIQPTEVDEITPPVNK
jgi:hypothetical protein